MAGDAQLLLTGLIGGLGLAAGLGYLIQLLGIQEAPAALRKHPDDYQVWRSRVRRRMLGAVLMAVLGAMFFIGANWIDASRAPVYFVVYWTVFAVMLAWLCVLALIDLVQMHRWRKRLLGRSHEQLEELLGRMRRRDASDDQEQ